MNTGQQNNQPGTGRTALVLGGTGAMGVYLVPELAAMGYDVRVVSLDEAVSDHPRISYVKADAATARGRAAAEKTNDKRVHPMAFNRMFISILWDYLLFSQAVGMLLEPSRFRPP